MSSSSSSHFELVSHWHLAAPPETVWQALKEVERWPQWWRYARAVLELQPGDAEGLGAVRHIAWSSRLPYGIRIEVQVIEATRPRRLVGRSRGQLEGLGIWELSPESGPAGTSTRVRYTWRVELRQRWMRWVAPLAAPVFRWNHDGIMRAGGEDLARYLGVRLIEAR